MKILFRMILGLALGGAGGACAFVALQQEWWSAAEEVEQQEDRDITRLICVGHVDTEAGVVSLRTTKIGRVVAICVKENQHVKQGDILLKLDDRQATARLRRTEAELHVGQTRQTMVRRAPAKHAKDLAIQQAAIAALMHKLSKAEQLLRQQERWSKQELLPQEQALAAAEDVKQLKAALVAEEKRLEKMQLINPHDEIALVAAEVGALRSQVAEAQSAVDLHRLVAPADGLALRVSVGIGDVVGPQSGLAPILFRADLPSIVRAEVPQEFADRVFRNQDVVVIDNVGGTKLAKGRVARLSRWFAERRSLLLEDTQKRKDVRTLECIIHLQPGAPKLRIGRRVHVHFLADSYSDS